MNDIDQIKIILEKIRTNDDMINIPSKEEAKEYIENYFKNYSGVKAFMENTTREAKEKGYVTTLFGRRRYIPELQAKNFNLRSFGERAAMNTPIQGTAADIITENAYWI